MPNEYESELEVIWEEARKHIANGQPDKAIEIFKYILLRYSEEPEVIEYSNAMLADLYLTKRQLVLAEKHIHKALDLQPENAAYHYILGFVFSVGRKWEPAIAEFTQALKIEPNKAEALRGLGWARYSIGDQEQGIGLLRRAASLEPQNFRILIDLAVALMPVDIKEAAKHAEKAIKLEPENGVVWKVLNQIKNFQRDFPQFGAQLTDSDQNDYYLLSDEEFIFQLKVAPQDNPAVWRVVEIKYNQLLVTLHKAISQAFDLPVTVSHSFFFETEHSKTKIEFASKIPGLSDATRTTRNIRVDSIGLFQDEKEKFRYLYDYEKMLWFEVELIRADWKRTKAKYPRVIKKLSRYEPKRNKK
jgi:tetratricopeptide (TPR) repeat protein